MEGRKKRKYSKSKKRNWRKNTDVKDVEEFLEDRSREQVTGIPATEKSNEQLFYVQKKIDGTKDTIPSKKLKKPLISELRLVPNSAVPGFPPCKRRKKVTKLSRCNQTDQSGAEVKLTHVDSSSDEDGYYKSASFQQQNSRENNKLATKMKEQPPRSSVQVAIKDLWSEKDILSGIPDEHYQKVTRKKLIKRPSTLSAKPSALTSIELPHAGMSYNPTFEDHQELLGMAVSVEEERARAADKLEKKLQLAKLTYSQREQVWLDEMRLHSDDDGSHSDDDEVETVMKRPVRAENRKTKKQRRKERERKEEEKQRAREKIKNIKTDEFYRLRSIKKEIADQERAALEKEQSRLEAEKLAPYQTHRLGKHHYEEQDIDVQLSTEMTGSLRNLKPEGNLATERYKSLQKRNVIEPRQLVKRRRKYKLLLKEKRSCKLPEELPT